MDHGVEDILHQASLALLERSGVGIASRSVLALLADHGLRVDFDRGRVFPGAEDVQRALASAPRGVSVYDRRGERPFCLGDGKAYILAGGGSLRVLTLEGRFEPASWAHLRQFNILLDALPNVDLCINQVDPQDDVGEDFYRRLAVEMLTGMPKPCLLQAGGAADVRAMLEMGSLLRGSRQALIEKPLFVIAANAEPPLTIPAHVAELLLVAFQAGLPAHLGNYNMLGITAPATVAGAVVQLNAMQLTALILAQLVRPGTPFLYSAFSGGGNLRNLDVAAAHPQAIQHQCLAARLGHFYRLPVYGIAACDAHLPDPQAACERATYLSLLMEAGVHLIQGPTSMMDALMLSSYAQAVIDNDIVGYVQAARRPPPLSEETLALDVIHDVVSDPTLRDLKFAAHAHTVRHMRDEVWQPICFDNEGFAAWQRAGAQTLLERATAVARHILDEHRPEPLPPRLARELRRIAASRWG